MTTYAFTVRAIDAVAREALSQQQLELTTSDPYWSSVMALLHLEGLVTDTAFANTATAGSGAWWKGGSAVLTEAEAAFGTTSLLLDGINSSIGATVVAAAIPGTGNLTLESEILPADGAYGGIFGFSTATSYNNRFLLRIEPGVADGTFRLQASCQGGSGTGKFITTADLDMSATEFSHVALTRSGGTGRIFFNGVLVGEASLSNNIASGNMRCGHIYTGGANTYYKGHIDECRYTKGVARYVANFARPTASHPND